MKRSYIIKRIVLITYSGKKIPLDNITTEVINRPLKSVKEAILDAFSNMQDPPVNININVKYL